MPIKLLNMPVNLPFKWKLKIKNLCAQFYSGSHSTQKNLILVGLLPPLYQGNKHAIYSTAVSYISQPIPNSIFFSSPFGLYFHYAHLPSERKPRSTLCSECNVNLDIKLNLSICKKYENVRNEISINPIELLKVSTHENILKMNHFVVKLDILI